MDTTDFQVGQVWRYAARPQESDAVFIVGGVEKLGDNSVVHISLRGLSLKNPHTQGGVQHDFPHLPMDENTLRACATQLQEEGAALPAEYTEGYDQWQQDGGGVWTVPINEIMDLIEQTVQPRKKWWQFFKKG